MTDQPTLRVGMHLPPELTLHEEQLYLAETAIRDKAGTVLSMIATRKSHPSFGYTKTAIRATFSEMQGMIGLYMVLTGQASHAGVPNMAVFFSTDTDERVGTARRNIEDL